MRFRISNKEGSALKFRLQHRDDGDFNFSVVESFKGTPTKVISAVLTRDDAETIAERLLLFFFDVDNPRTETMSAEEREKLFENRKKLYRLTEQFFWKCKIPSPDEILPEEIRNGSYSPDKEPDEEKKNDGA